MLLDGVDYSRNGALWHTQRIMLEGGVTFKNAFAAAAICCPARASLLTGRYPHNTGVHGNSLSAGCCSRHWQEGAEKQTLGVLAQAAPEQRPGLQFLGNDWTLGVLAQAARGQPWRGRPPTAAS